MTNAVTEVKDKKIIVEPIVNKTAGVIELTKAELLKDKEEGLTINEQAKKYALPITQMRKALKMAGITMKAKPKLKFKFVDTATTETITK